MKLTITLFAFVLSLTTFSQGYTEIHCEHFFYGYPKGSPTTNDLIIRDIYAMSNNDDTKFADWVTYRLTMHEVDGDLVVERKWKADPWLEKEETLEPKPDDYKGANAALKTDRGHQAPLGSFKGSRHASQTNYLSNITPQKSHLNQGPWKRLEDRVRDLVRACNEAYVMTGTLYEKVMEKLPQSDEEHKVPSGYWKIICKEEKGQIEVAAFIFDQETPRADKILVHQVTVDEVEERSGLDFMWEMEDGKENTIEGTKNTEFASKFFKD